MLNKGIDDLRKKVNYRIDGLRFQMTREHDSLAMFQIMKFAKEGRKIKKTRIEKAGKQKEGWTPREACC